MRDAYITLFKLTPGARYKARQDALRYLRLASDYGSWLQDDMSTSLGSRAPTVKLPAVEFVLSPHEEGSDSEANIQQVCSSSFEARGNMTSWDSLPGSGSFEPLIYVEARTATLLLTLLRHRKENAGLYTTVLEGYVDDIEAATGTMSEADVSALTWNGNWFDRLAKRATRAIDSG